MSRGHPYEYDGNLDTRYPRATIVLTGDELERTQSERFAKSMRQHWANMKAAEGANRVAQAR